MIRVVLVDADGHPAMLQAKWMLNLWLYLAVPRAAPTVVGRSLEAAATVACAAYAWPRVKPTGA